LINPLHAAITGASMGINLGCSGTIFVEVVMLFKIGNQSAGNFSLVAYQIKNTLIKLLFKSKDES